MAAKIAERLLIVLKLCGKRGMFTVFNPARLGLADVS